LPRDGVFAIPTKIIKVPDPVVLQPVKDGYLIVTSWGGESEDPIIINPKNN